MKITSEQTAELFRFIRKKRVQYYELQSELADHLASQIEAYRTEDPTLSFEAALRKAYAQFGIFGFAKIVQEREREMNRFYCKRWWRSFFKMFGWPSALFTLFTFMVIYSILLFDQIGLILIFFIAWMIMFFVHSRIIKHNLKSKHRLMMIEFSPNLNSFSLFAYQGILFNLLYSSNIYVQTIVLTIGVLIQAVNIKMLLASRREAQMTYPELFETT